MDSLRIFAAIIISFALIKMLVLLIHPSSWIKFARNFYKNPRIVSIMAMIGAIFVLFKLLNAGFTITQIFAVMLFMTLLMVAGMAYYVRSWLKEVNLKDIVKKQWLYIIFWVILVIWGFYEVFLM